MWVVCGLYAGCMRVVCELFEGCKGMQTDRTFLALQYVCKGGVTGVGMHTDGTLHVKEEGTQTEHYYI